MADRRRNDSATEIRRLRDLVRAAVVVGGGYPGGVLPAERDLMAGHAASRATVRGALALLREEGLIKRIQGRGTHVVAVPASTGLGEAHGTAAPRPAGLFDGLMRPRVLDRSRVSAPDTVAARLGVGPGTPCLRLEYVALLGGEPVGLATNYVVDPEAALIDRCAFDTDWYALLAGAGAVIGDSEFAIGCEPADPWVADVLGIPASAPLLLVEQLISDPGGRPFDFALIHTRADRFRFVSRLSRSEELI